MKASTAVVCALAVLLPCVASQGLRWRQVETGGEAQPSARSAASFGYDPLGNQLILFSGFGGTNDTWIFDIASSNWSQVLVTQPTPVTRGLGYFGVVVIDGESLFVVTHGIYDDEYEDVWAFRFSTMEWVQIEPEGTGPGFRYGGHFGATFGETNILWIGGGFTDKTTPLASRYIDTYKLVFSSPTTATWQVVYGQPSPGNQFMPLNPHGRCLQSSAVIADYGLVIAGGCMNGGRGGGPCPSDDTWFFNNNTSSWKELNRCMTPRAYGAMAALSNDSGKAVLYGGTEDPGFSMQLLSTPNAPYEESEVFVFDASQSEWKRYRAEAEGGIFPARRSELVMAAAPNGVIYMFGGLCLSNGTYMNDLWTLSGDVSETTEIGCNNVWFSYPHLHGLLMFLAFGLLFPLGVVVAQVFKCKNSIVWFIFHVIIQVTAVLSACVAFIIIFAATREDPTHPHAIIGIFLMFFMLIQPINGIFRPHIKKDKAKSKYRICWEWFHRCYGFFVLLLGFTQVTLGVFLIVPPLAVWVVWIILLCVWVIGFIVINTIRVIFYFCRTDESSVGTHIEMK